MESTYRTRPGAPTEVNADIKEAVLARLSRRRLQPLSQPPRHALDRQLVEAMNGLGFGTSPSTAVTVQTVPF
jgi:hypothetical protein